MHAIRVISAAALALTALGGCNDSDPMGEPGQADPFEAVAAERAACEEAADGAQADGPEGLRIAAVTQLGPLAPGGESAVQVTLAEVSGLAFMDYPAVRVTPVDPSLTVLDPEAGQWFGIFGCDAQTVRYAVAADEDARDDLPLRVEVSTLRCLRDGECGDWHGVDVVLAAD